MSEEENEFSPLSVDEIGKFVRRRGVKAIAVQNFLATVDNNKTLSNALSNLEYDASLYNWNTATYEAIKAGIFYSYRKKKKGQ